MQTETKTWTDTLAILGAITGVIGTVAGLGALIWDFYKWKTSGRPRLRISASGPMVSTDPRDKDEYISITVTNYGDRATTISALAFRYWKKKPSRLWKTKPDQRGLINTLAIQPSPLPKKLDVGEVWTHLHPLGDDTKTMAQQGYFFLEIEDAYSKNALKFAKTRLVLS